MRLLPLALPLLALPLAALACSSADDPTGAGGTGGAGAGAGTGGGTTTSSSSAGGAPPTGLLSGTVQRYTYAFNLATAHATSTLDVDVAPPGGDCFAVNCELLSASMGLWNGAPAKSATVANNALAFCGDQGVAGGAALKVGADVDVLQKTFLLGLDVGFSKRKDMAGGTFTYLLSWVGGCDHFGPCDDDPSRLASFHFDITHAQGDVVLCPGVLTPGATLTQCELSGTLAPTYSAFALASDPLWKRTDLLTVAGTNIVFYEVPTGQIAKSLDLASVTAFFQWITGLLGPLPYGKELRFAGAPTAWLGFEHPANIILDQQLPQVVGAYINPTMHVLMHETVHQWAGDRSTIATASDFAWKEATAEYLSYVFEDEQRPAAEAAASLAYWDSRSLQSNHYARPTDNPPPAIQSFYSDVYGPGPMVFYVQLETMLGRPTVLDGIKGFLAQPGARSVDDLRKALEAASGQDLKPYFDAWVFGAGKPEWPTFDVTTSQIGNQVTVTVTQKNLSQKLYGCKLDVRVNGATQNALATVDFGLAPKVDTVVTTVTLAEPVMSTTVDPRHRVVGRVVGVPVAEPPKLKVWIL